MPDSPASPLPATTPDGVTTRTLVSGAALFTEALTVGKIAADETLDVLEAVASSSFDLYDGLADEFGGPLAPLAKAPTSFSRPIVVAAAEGTRRVLAAV